MSKRELTKSDFVIVASPCHLLIILCRLVGIRNVYLDAGWPLLDSTLIRSKNDSIFRKIFLRVKSKFIDYFSFRLSRGVFLESYCQKFRYAKFAKTSPRFFVSYTGFNEFRIQNEDYSSASYRTSQIQKAPYAFFRGKNNEEANLPRIIDLFSKLDNEISLIIATDNLDKKIEIPPNIQVLEGYLTREHLVSLYQKSILTVGQFGSSNRQNITIPHKVFEAAYFGKPYLTPISCSLLEVLPRNAALYLEVYSEDEMIRQIKKYLQSSTYLHTIGNRAQEIYNWRFSNTKIALDFMSKLYSISGNG
jgi:hypothetical protein